MRLSRGALGAALVAGALVAAAGMWRGRALYIPVKPAVLSTQTPRASEARCAECHPGIAEDFHTAPHSRTLTRATGEAAEHFAGKSFHREGTDLEYHYELRDGRLFVSTPAYARDLPIDWIFGSGMHAQTPLITWTDDAGNTSAIEHSVSWYPHGGLGVTLGMEELENPLGIAALGIPRTPAEAINCFGCHATFVPTDGGRIRFENIEPNISCARCHWDTERHVDEMEKGLPLSMERFSELTPLESINRCGECHRRADELGGPLAPHDKTLIRFAPVGLAQSPCFQHQEEVILDSGQPARLDCTTCHDPHRPAVRDWRHHATACLNCHDEAHGRAPDCTVAARDENCLPCHMPKVDANKQLEFTDHWIRVRTGE